MRKRNPWKLIFIILFAAAVLVGIYMYQQQYEPGSLLEKAGEKLFENAPEIFSGEPKEVRELRKQKIAGTDEQSGRREYYFGLLTEEEQRGYREMLTGIQNREKEFYLTVYEDDTVNRVYHAVLMDHPELFWMNTAYGYQYAPDGSIAEIDLSFNITATQMDTAKASIESPTAMTNSKTR